MRDSCDYAVVSSSFLTRVNASVMASCAPSWHRDQPTGWRQALPAGSRKAADCSPPRYEAVLGVVQATALAVRDFGLASALVRRRLCSNDDSQSLGLARVLH